MRVKERKLGSGATKDIEVIMKTDQPLSDLVGRYFHAE